MPMDPLRAASVPQTAERVLGGWGRTQTTADAMQVKIVVHQAEEGGFWPGAPGRFKATLSSSQGFSTV